MTKTAEPAICDWCLLIVAATFADDHAAWHRLHDLHGPYCAKATNEKAQRNSPMYLYPAPCDCGLDAQ